MNWTALAILGGYLAVVAGVARWALADDVRKGAKPDRPASTFLGVIWPALIVIGALWCVGKAWRWVITPASVRRVEATARVEAEQAKAAEAAAGAGLPYPGEINAARVLAGLPDFPATVRQCTDGLPHAPHGTDVEAFPVLWCPGVAAPSTDVWKWCLARNLHGAHVYAGKVCPGVLRAGQLGPMAGRPS